MKNLIARLHLQPIEKGMLLATIFLCTAIFLAAHLTGCSGSDSLAPTALPTTAPVVRALVNGQTLYNLSAVRGNWLYYTITVPSGMTELRVKTNSGTGDADLYIKFGTRPTTSSYDVYSDGNDNDETCTKADPSAGVWNIGVYAYADFSGVTLAVDYEASLTPLTLALFVGTYQMLGFHVWNGTDFTEDDMTTWSGTMKIYSSGLMKQWLTLNGTPNYAVGTILEVQDDGSPGYAGRMKLSSGGCIYWLDIIYRQQAQTLETLFLKECGTSFNERDLWKKTSSSTSAALSNDIGTSDESLGNIGSGLGSLWNHLP